MALSAEEAEVGKRIRLVRKEHGVSQRLAAAQMGLSRSQLDRIERGNVAVRLEPALRFCEFTNRNPLWLAWGESENRFGFFWLSPIAAQEADTKAFKVGDEWASDPAVAEAVARDATLLEVIWKHKERFSRATRFFATSNREPRWRLGPPKPIGALFLGASNVKTYLTTQHQFAIPGSMNLPRVSLWPKLRERILKVVGRRGMKSALARDMRVSRQAVNALLSSERRDVASADYAWLMAWVELAEAQQKKSAASVSDAPPARKTRKRKSK